jgi:solute carrier family 25 carnitine/acylcarnitine transporter 20/29
LQTQSNTNPLYKGPLDAIKKIYGQRGIAGIYKGQAVTLLREATGYGVYFLTYEKLVQWEMTKKGMRRDQISPVNAILYGAGAGYAVSSNFFSIVSP